MASSTRAFALPRLSVSRLPAPLRRVTTLLSALFLAAMLVAAILAPTNYGQQDRARRFEKPSAANPLGTDASGRDVLGRLMYGARISLSVAVAVQAVELLIGLTLGMWGGLKGGRLDSAVMRLADLMFAFPDILLAILITGLFGKSLFNVFIALALVGWPGMVRLVRSQVLSLREKEFVEAARAMGATDFRLTLRHLLPNILGPVVVGTTVGMGAIVLAESTLSFLGLGIQPPEPSWGSMIHEGWQDRYTAPALTLYPALCVAGTIMAFNFLGDGLRDWLDPRSRGA